MWPSPQTCSRPPLKSMDIFGVDCSGPGLPLCLHHLASRLTVAQHGPIRIRFLSLRLVLSRKSFMLSRNDDPRITPRENKRGVHVIIIPCQKICLRTIYIFKELSFILCQNLLFQLASPHIFIPLIQNSSYEAGIPHSHSSQRDICQNIMTFSMCEHFKFYE